MDTACQIPGPHPYHPNDVRTVLSCPLVLLFPGSSLYVAEADLELLGSGSVSPRPIELPGQWCMEACLPSDRIY